jgi:hypothetical protein
VTDGFGNSDTTRTALIISQPINATVSFFDSVYTASVLLSSRNLSVVPVIDSVQGNRSSLLPTTAFPSTVNFPIFTLSNENFFVNSSSGELILNGSLNAPFYDVMISVSLVGYPNISAFCHVSITVKDDTPHLPQLRKSAIEAFVPFDTFAGTSVGQVEVVSIGLVDVVSYSLRTSNSSLPFFVHSTTGAIVLFEALNISRIGFVYTFFVDVSNSFRVASASVTLTISQSTSCIGVVCLRTCYTGGTCQFGQCTYSGVSNSLACRPIVSCTCSREVLDGIVW